MGIHIQNDLASVISLTKSTLRGLDISKENTTLPTETLLLIFSTLIALSEGKELATKPWIGQHMATVNQFVSANNNGGK